MDRGWFGVGRHDAARLAFVTDGHDELWDARRRAAHLERTLAQVMSYVNWALDDLNGGHAKSLIGCKRHLVDAQRVYKAEVESA